MQVNLTSGKIGTSLVKFSLPMILGNLLQQGYNIADTLIVGRTLGAPALAAVGSSYTLMVLLTSVVLGLCMGSGAVFSQLYGAKKYNQMKISIVNAGVFVLIISVVVNIAAYLLVNKLILWLNIPAESTAFTHNYLSTIFAGIIFVSAYNFFAAVLRSTGNTVMPLVFLGAAAVTNIVLDILFIVYFNMGVQGAALATVISQGLSAICIAAYFVLKAGRICPRKKHFRYNKALLKLVANNSVLSAVQQSIMNLGILFVQGLVNSFGFAASAAFAVAVKIDATAYMPAQDFGNAFATFVAQNHGAKNQERIQKGAAVAVKLSGAFCLVVSFFVWIFAKPLMMIFVNGKEVETIRIGVQYLQVVGAFYIGIGMLFLLYGLYRGLGKSSVSIVLTVISLGTRVALANILAAIPGVGLVGIWWAVPIGWALADTFGIWHFIKNKNR